MKQKLLLTLLALFTLIGGGNLYAQTNIIAGWDGGDDTGSPSNFGWSSSTNRTLNSRNASGGVRMTTTYSGYKLEDGSTYSYSASSDPSSVIFWVRYGSSGESYTYTFQGLEPDHYYDFSALVGWHNNSNAPTFSVKINDGTSDLTTMSKSVSTKQTLYEISSRFQTPSSITNTTYIKIMFTCNQTGDCMEAISALKLVEVIDKNELQAALTYANRVNSDLNNSTLASEITTAQDVYDNPSATQTQVNEAVSTLNTAVVTALAEDAPADMTFVIDNPGFENCTVTSTNAAATGSAAPLIIAGNWTQVKSATWSSSAVVEYGGAGQVNGASAPSSDNTGNSGKTLGISVGWEGLVSYQSSSVTLPAGVYTLKVNSYNANTDAQQFTSKFGFVPSTGNPALSTKTSFASSTWEIDEVTFTLSEATEGKIQVGGQAVSGGSGSNAKVFFDNITLAYENPLAAAITAWNTAHSTLEGLDETLLPEAAENAITTELAKERPNTEAEIVAATAALQALIDSYDGIKAAYDKVNDLITFVTNEMTNSTGTKTDIESAINTARTNKETRTTASDLENDYNTLESARQTYVTSGAVPTEGNVFDYTFKIADAAVTGTGWSESGTASGEQYTGAPDNKYFDCGWNSTLHKNQKVESLPAGYYTLKAATRAKASEVTEANIYVNQEREEYNRSTDNHRDGNTGGELGNGWSWTEVEFELRAIEDVTIGFYAKTTGQGWAGADDFHLYYKAAFEGATDEQKLALSNAIINAENKTLGFQNGEYAPYNNIKVLEALKAAKALNVDEATGEEVVTAANAIADTEWTPNTGEVNAIFDGQFATTEANTQSGDINLPGWTKVEGIRMLVKNVETDPGLAYADGQAGVFSWGGTTLTYGEKEGYTLPMNKYSIYELTMKVSGWRDGDLPSWISVELDSDKQTYEQSVAGRVNQAEGNPFTTLTFYLEPTEDNSILKIYVNKHFVIADLNLVLAVAGDVTLKGTDTEAPKSNYANVTTDRKLLEGLNTVVFPFETTATELGAATVLEYTGTTVENDAVTLNFHEVAAVDDVVTLQANTPYAVFVDADQTENLTFDTKIISPAENLTVDDTNNEFDFVGTYKDLVKGNDVVVAGDYVAGAQAFKKAKGGNRIAAYRAYLKKVGTGDAKVAFNFDGNIVDGIEAIELLNKFSAEGIFNLQGQKVNNAQKGVYIVNGKKIVVK